MATTDPKDNKKRATLYKQLELKRSAIRNYSPKKLILGTGKFSVVFLAIHPNNASIVAAKVVDLLKWNKEYNNEIRILQKLNHASIIHLVDTEKFNGHGVIYLEYLSYPTLGDYIKNTSTLSERSAVKVLFSLVDAVCYLHNRGISHHDLKPDNMLFNSERNTIKIFDFGLAIIVNPGDPFSSSTAGSPLYMAPEVLLEDQHNAFDSDIWSIGISFYEMLLGVTPFEDCQSNKDIVIEWRRSKNIALPLWISSPLRLLYSEMVDYNPDTRISDIDLRRRLIHTTKKKYLGISTRGSGVKHEGGVLSASATTMKFLMKSQN